jgi:sugar lactone lactonase YvrE
LAAFDQDNLVVLDQGKRLLFANSRSGEPRTIRLPESLEVMDLAGGGRLGENLIFVALRGINTLSPVVQYTPQGKELRRWIVPGEFPIGLALDYFHKVLYITALGNASVYRVDLNQPGGGKATFVQEVRGASRLGPAAVDSTAGRLYVADVFSGTIYVVSLATRTSSVLISGMGQPSALALARGGQVLYVADVGRRCIWTVRLGPGAPVRSRFAPATPLRQPYGLTVDSRGTVWVGDRGPIPVFGVAPNGTQLRTIP